MAEEISQLPLTVDTVTEEPIIDASCEPGSEESEKVCDKLSQDLFQGSSDTVVDCHSNENKQDKATVSNDAAEQSNNQHAMVTRSKGSPSKGVLSTRSGGRKSARSRYASIKSFGSTSYRSGSNKSSCSLNLSNTQLVHLYNTKKSNQMKKVEIEKKQLSNRLERERLLLEENMRREEEELLQELERQKREGYKNLNVKKEKC